MTESATKPRVLVFTFTPIAGEPRALKQIHALKERYSVTTTGFGGPVDPDIEHIELDPKRFSGRWFSHPVTYALMLGLRRYKWLSRHRPFPREAIQKLHGRQWDVVIAHDVLTVPVANDLKPAAGVLVDLHEYAPRQGEHSFGWRVLMAPYMRWLIGQEVARAKAVSTVSQSIVEEYERQFGLETLLVTNASPYRAFEPAETHFPIRLVHTGIASPARKLEVMVDAVLASTSDVTLDLFLMPTDELYLERLKERAQGDPRIRFNDPVPYSELVETLHDFDVGVSVIVPSTFNLEMCLPNKFFDFIQARLGVLVGPSVEMMRYVESLGIGDVTEDFTSGALAERIASLTPEKVDSWKAAAARAAMEVSGEKQAQIWVDAVDRMVTDADVETS